MNTTITALILLLLTQNNSGTEFKILAEGIEYSKVELKNYSDYTGELHLIRINPQIIKPRVLISKEQNIKPMTAKDWCNKFNLNIAVNLGMYHKDFSSHVGYLKNGEYINNPKFNEYKSALLINPSEKHMPYATIIDLDNPDEKIMIKKYNTVVQNLRLIKGNGINVWKKTGQSWPDAGIGTDKKGNLIIFFTSTPVLVYELNEILLKLPLGIIKAFHTDGGPPASLSVHIRDFHLDLSGNLISKEQEPIPNILGFGTRD